jgi:curved DNA-binding protein CbpA
MKGPIIQELNKQQIEEKELEELKEFKESLKKKNYYEILGVNNNADELEIKRAFRKKSLTFHPDKVSSQVTYFEKQKAGLSWNAINEAKETLLNKEERQKYDANSTPMKSFLSSIFAKTKFVPRAKEEENQIKICFDYLIKQLDEKLYESQLLKNDLYKETSKNHKNQETQKNTTSKEEFYEKYQDKEGFIEFSIADSQSSNFANIFTIKFNKNIFSCKSSEGFELKINAEKEEFGEENKKIIDFFDLIQDQIFFSLTIYTNLEILPLTPKQISEKAAFLGQNPKKSAIEETSLKIPKKEEKNSEEENLSDSFELPIKVKSVITSQNLFASNQLRNLALETKKIANANHLNLFHLTISGIVKEFEDDRFDFSSDNKSLLEDAKDGSRQIILEALENSINKSKISKNEAAVAMMIALKNNGLGSSENKNGLIEDLKLIFPNKNQNNLLKKVLNFSQFFQKETQKLRMFTPSQTAAKFVGISLKRVPPNYALENLDFTKMHEDGLDKNHAFKALSQEAGIANIEELITPKTNVSSSESTNLKNGQKHTKSCSESINSFAARSF